MIKSSRNVVNASLIKSNDVYHDSERKVRGNSALSGLRVGSQRTMASSQSPRQSLWRRPGNLKKSRTGVFLVGVLSAAPTAMADCISLAGSSTCKAFQSASVSNSSTNIGLYSFMSQVTDRASFDKQLISYISTSFVQKQYETLLGCEGIDLTNTSDLYARFSISVICNTLVQNSITDCKLSGKSRKPLCADSCAQYAESEAYIAADSQLCSKPSSDSDTQIRADFTNCALPSDSLSSASSGECIEGADNEPDNCGYRNSLVGLCSYCGTGGTNSTDTCCYNSDAETRCQNVTLPSITANVSLITETATVSAGNKGLSGGAIAGIVIGSIAALALLALLGFLCFRRAARRKSGSQQGSIFNQPSPSRQGPTQSMSALDVPKSKGATAPQGYEVLPGGRIARMSALEGYSGDSPSRHGESRKGDLRRGDSGSTSAAAVAARRRGERSSEDIGESPESNVRAGALRPPPMTGRRNGSLSSGSVLAGGETPSSPTSAGGMSSPYGMSQQSEQLPFFKDYYSQDDIHPGDRVSVLWAYQPRAADEFPLERGDMLKVVGIWDDGWATGIMVDEHADEWESRRQAQRDSGVSHMSTRGRPSSPPVSGDIKAFPLVCVCLPEHWRKTIEGDGSTETASSAVQGNVHSP